MLCVFIAHTAALAAPPNASSAGTDQIWHKAGPADAFAIDAHGTIRFTAKTATTAGIVSPAFTIPSGCDAVLVEARVAQADAGAVAFAVHDADGGEAIGYWRNPLPIQEPLDVSVIAPFTRAPAGRLRIFAGTHEHASHAAISNIRWTPVSRNMSYRSVVWGALVDDAHRAAQTFRAKGGALAAVVFRVRDLNLGVRPETAPGLRVRLYTWKNDLVATRAGKPLAETVVPRHQIPSADGSRERDLTVALPAPTTPGAMYLVDVTPAGPCSEKDALLLFSGEDAYADGTRYENDRELAHSDLYLETYESIGLPIAECRLPIDGRETGHRGSKTEPKSERPTAAGRAPQPAAGRSCLPEPPATPIDQRSNCYSMVYYYLVDDEALTRRYLETLRDLGATQVLTLVYWWQAETLGGDYWKKDYQPNQIGEGWQRSLDYYVNIARELGLRPSLRLGSFREWNGLWHPAEPTGSVERYAEWVRRLAERYRGRIDHYVIGDEENKPHAASGFDGSAKAYLEKMLIPLAAAVRAGDPSARISACGSSSSPAVTWTLELIRLGLPRYADGVACNFWYAMIENRWEIEDFIRKVRELWPACRFYANGVIYADHRGLHDERQAAVVAQCMFTLWDLGWDSAPYYLYTFSRTADTNQNFGLLELPTATRPATLSDAWHAYQTIAQTFGDRRELAAPPFAVRLRQASQLHVDDGSTIRIAPPEPFLRAWVRGDRQLLIYLVYPNLREPREGHWDVLLETDVWGCPKQIPLLNYRDRLDHRYHRESGALVLENVNVSMKPTILTLTPLGRD